MRFFKSGHNVRNISYRCESKVFVYLNQCPCFAFRIPSYSFLLGELSDLWSITAAALTSLPENSTSIIISVIAGVFILSALVYFFVYKKYKGKQTLSKESKTLSTAAIIQMENIVLSSPSRQSSTSNNINLEKSLDLAEYKEKNHRRGSIEEISDDQIMGSEIFRFMTEKVNIKQSHAIHYSRSILLDGYDTMKSIANSKKFNISKYIDKEGKCSEFQIQLDDLKLENHALGSRISSPTLGSASAAKVVQLSASLDRGEVSGCRSVVLDGLYSDKRFVNIKVKVKLMKHTHEAEVAINNEYEIADEMNARSAGCFIKVFSVLYGSEKQIILFEGSDDNLTDYIALVMERGKT